MWKNNIKFNFFKRKINEKTKNNNENLKNILFTLKEIKKIKSKIVQKKVKKKEKVYDFEKCELFNDLIYGIKKNNIEDEPNKYKKDRLYKYILRYKKLVNDSLSNPVYFIELDDRINKGIIEYIAKNYKDKHPLLKLRKNMIYYWK